MPTLKDSKTKDGRVFSIDEFVNSFVKLKYSRCSILDFIGFWKEFYGDDDWKEYERFLNMEKPLKENHVLRATSWKKGWDWKPSRTTRSFGRWKTGIKAWIRELKFLNSVRRNRMSILPFDDELIDRDVFPRTIRMRTFVAHVTRPLEWPILDENVWRAYEFIAGIGNSEDDDYTFDDYNEYIKFFKEIDDSYRKSMKTKKMKLRRLKDVDEALMAFGRFLKAYEKGLSPEKT